MAVDVILIGNATFCQCVYVIEKTFCHFSALFSLSRLIALSVSVQNTLNMISIQRKTTMRCPNKLTLRLKNVCLSIKLILLTVTLDKIKMSIFL